jgi:hypothetical protein
VYATGPDRCNSYRLFASAKDQRQNKVAQDACRWSVVDFAGRWGAVDFTGRWGAVDKGISFLLDACIASKG